MNIDYVLLIAREEAALPSSTWSPTIVIDGARLAELMIRYGMGVQVTDTYAVVEVDEDYFE